MNRRRAVLLALLCAPVALSHAQPAAKVMRVGQLDLAAAFAAMAQSKPDAVFITQSAFLMSQHKSILQLAAKYRVPVVGFRSNQAEAGALMSYNSSLADHTRRAAQLVDRVLKGAKPADIPVELPTTFELVINMKTAKALGITIPQSVLLQASRVIE